MLGNRRYCYPLTITDFASRYLLTCEALSTTQEHFAFTVFERTFKEFGLPQAIRTDNGVPFACPMRSTASANWPSGGCASGSDRTHHAGPAATKRPARADASDVEAGSDQAGRENLLQQQARFDAFVDCLQPGAAASGAGDESARPTSTDRSRVYRGLEDLTYPFHDHTIIVTHCGRICLTTQKVNLSHVFAGQNVGVTQVGERIWLVTFMHYDLGYFDDETCRLEPIDNPFGPKVLPMCSE